jgi:hypothetical protein
MKDLSKRDRAIYIAASVIAGIIIIAIAASGGGTSHKASTHVTAPSPATTTTATTNKSDANRSKPKGDPKVDENTRAYLNVMASCQTAVGLILIDIKKGGLSDVAFADETTQARDICDGARSKVLSMNTDHFDDQAATGYYAIDRYKSGLNAMLAYIDNPRPTKVIEARNKLQEGDQAATETTRTINQRRHVYGLRSYHP